MIVGLPTARANPRPIVKYRPYRWRSAVGYIMVRPGRCCTSASWTRSAAISPVSIA